MSKWTPIVRNSGRSLVLAAAASLMLAATVAPAPAATADQTRSEKYYREAQEYLKKGDVNTAVIQLKNALKADPGNVDARLSLGEIYLRLGNGAYAEKEIKAAEQRGAPFADLMVNLGRAYLLQGRFDDVLKEITPERATDANRADVLIVRGEAQLGLRRFDLAEAAFREAHQTNPKETRALVGIAQAFVNRGRVKEAEEQVDLALKATPDLVEAQILKGDLRRINRDGPGAIAAYTKAIEHRPNNVRARLGRAAALIDLNRDSESEDDLKAVLKQAPRYPMARYLQALSLAKKKDYVGAKDMLLDAGSALDEHLPSMFLKGAISYALGEYEQATVHLSRYLEAIPQNLRARKMLAAVHVRNRQPARALEVLTPVAKDAGDDPQLLTLLGSVHMQLGEVNKGTEYFQKAAEAAPDQAGIRTQLALGRLAQGKADQAEGDLEVALELDKDASRAGILLALVRLRKGEFKEAAESAEQLRKSMPDSPLPPNLLGAAYLGQGDMAKAREMFGEALKQKSDFNPARMNLAQLDAREGKFEAAKSQYNAILESDARNAGAMMGLANLAIAEKKPEEVETWLKRASEADSRSLAPRLRLIAFYSESGSPQKALEAARELNASVPNRPEVLEVLGRSEIAAGNPQNGVEAYRTLTELLPKSTRAHALLASAQVLAQDLKGARTSLEKALEIDDSAAQTHVALIELDMREQRYDEALKRIDIVKQKQPKAPVADMLRGDVYFQQGRFDEAIKAYDAARALEDGPVLALRRYNAERAAGQGDTALAWLEAWLAKNDHRAVRHVLASAYISEKNYPKAIAHWEKLLEPEPNNPVVLNNLAWLYQETGNSRAKELGERALAAAPQSPAVMDTLGWILVQSDNASRGLELLRKASDAAPNQGDIRFHMAAALHRTGRAEDARKELEKLLASAAEMQNFSKKADAEALLKELGGG